MQKKVAKIKVDSWHVKFSPSPIEKKIHHHYQHKACGWIGAYTHKCEEQVRLQPSRSRKLWPEKCTKDGAVVLTSSLFLWVECLRLRLKLWYFEVNQILEDHLPFCNAVPCSNFTEVFGNTGTHCLLQHACGPLLRSSLFSSAQETK